MQSVLARKSAHITKSDLIAVERPPIHPTAVYDVTDAAAITKTCPETIRRAIKDNQLVASFVGTSPRLTGKRLLEWLDSLEKIAARPRGQEFDPSAEWVKGASGAAGTVAPSRVEAALYRSETGLTRT